MMTRLQANDGKRIEYAPAAVGEPGAAAGVVSVVLGDDEDVQWYWTHYPDGRSVVTGYGLTKKDRDAEEEGFSFKKAVTELLWPDNKNKDGDSHLPSAPDKSLNRTRERAGFLR